MPIGFDHKDFLIKGTIDEIVYEKCAHLLGGSKIIVSEQKEDVLKNIKKNISKNSSLKKIFGEDYKYTKVNSGFVYKDQKGEINLPYPNLLGDFQISNVSTAISAVRNLDQFKIKESHIREAITKIRSEGRLQFIKEGKLRKYVSNNNEILIDGAHNILAAKEIEKYLGSLNSGRKIIMLLGMMSNKEHKEFIQTFKNRVHSIIALNIPNQVNFIVEKNYQQLHNLVAYLQKLKALLKQR
tara:strand:- start:90 stop:809 length:720 start_codon:yes stop_codon:yes gene_type:complete